MEPRSDDCVSLGSASIDDQLSTWTPFWVDDSNVGWDDSGVRVTVSGSLDSDLLAFNGEDNAHQTMGIVWEVPEGRVLREVSQPQFRGRFDWNCDRLGSNDPFISLFYSSKKGDANLQNEAVTIISESATRLEISINVQDALEAVRDAYEAEGIDLTDTGCP